MPTVKPRITITVDENQHRLLSTLAELQGVSMSSIVVDFLDTVTPVLERLTVILQSAKNAPENAREELRKNLNAAEASFLPVAHEMMGQLDLLVSVAGGGDAACRAAPPAVAQPAEPRPPTSNRGVRKTNTSTKTRLSSSVSPMKTAKKGRGASK
jgi:hypothetical protein